jgi:hypothetical protein
VGCRSAPLSKRGNGGPRRDAGSSSELRDVLCIDCRLGDGPFSGRRSPHEYLVHASTGPQTVPGRNPGRTAVRLNGNRMGLPLVRGEWGDSRLGRHALGSPASSRRRRSVTEEAYSAVTRCASCDRNALHDNCSAQSEAFVEDRIRVRLPTPLRRTLRRMSRRPSRLPWSGWRSKRSCRIRRPPGNRRDCALSILQLFVRRRSGGISQERR